MYPTSPPATVNGIRPAGGLAPDVHRTLPHSMEAEKGLISSMILSPAGVIPAVAVLPASVFYLPAHQTVSQLLVDRWNANQPTDVITLTQALRDHRQLDAVGGPAFVTELFTYVPTAANADYYLGIVREQATLRSIALLSGPAGRAYETNVNADDLLAELRGHLELIGADGQQETPCVGLGELPSPTPGDPDELLRHRLLCRGGGLLLVGPTGVGKSSFSLQALTAWALGRECFGIAPSRPLRSLLIQAENDAGDLAEMRDGVLRGMDLSPADRAQALAGILVRREDARTGPEFFRRTVEPLLRQHRPDLLVIDPALSFLGGESNSQADVGGFLRNGLNPLLHRYGCAAIVVHHTNKPLRGEEKADWSAGDFAYLGGGSAEWANWARAVVAIRSVGSHKIFELRLGKRGGRAGWTDPGTGERSYARLIAHDDRPGVIYWRESDPVELSGESDLGSKRKPQPEDLLKFIPELDTVEFDVLMGRAASAGTMGKHKVRDFLAVLRDEGKVFEWHLPRPGKRSAVAYARRAQPEDEESSRPGTKVGNNGKKPRGSDVPAHPFPPVGGEGGNITPRVGKIPAGNIVPARKTESEVAQP